MLRPAENGVLKVVGAVVAALVALLALAVVAALAFSVKVEGTSMAPTLQPGDRLDVDLLHRHDVDRFDLVEAAEPQPNGGSGAMIVKRVIGLPGDQVAVAGGDHPVVYLREAGSSTTYRVVSTTWAAQVGAAIVPCCTAKGSNLPVGGVPKRWATVPPDSYWVIGDNWGGSTDSRVFGFVPRADVKATLWLRIGPWGRRGHVPNPASLVPTA